jgi:aconitate hydratase
MIAIGAGGLDVATAMAGAPFYLEMPKVTGIMLHGELKLGVSAKDVILDLLKRFGVKGGVGRVFEYLGDGVNTLSVPERATITNMGTETGATTSIFPSDYQTKKWLKSQQREEEWIQLGSYSEAEYDEIIDVTLDDIIPLVAEPHSPGHVRTVSELTGLKVNQVAIGSCTNSSYRDLMTVANILKDKKVHPEVSLIVSPGSRQVLKAISENGALTNLISSGARILECTCGPCIGMGQAPPTNGVTLRTFNRNFEGRSGTNKASIYLVSPEVAATSAIEGVLTDPRDYSSFTKISFPEKFDVDDSLIIKPSLKPYNVRIIRGPNIKSVPINEQLPQRIVGEVLLKVADNVTTDHIMPAGAKILPLRSNIPAISQYVFNRIDPTFPSRTKKKKGGIIVGGENFGQGSSREHAALALMYLGIKAITTISFSRIHKANLVNFGVLPLEFMNKKDYKKISRDDILEIPKIRERIERGKIIVKNHTKNLTIDLRCDLSPRFKNIVLAGGLMNMIKNSQS